MMEDMEVMEVMEVMHILKDREGCKSACAHYDLHPAYTEVMGFM